METDRELLSAAGAPRRLGAVRPALTDEAVPMLRFLVGTGRAVLALARFLLEVAGDDGPDPIALEPRILTAF